MRQNFVAYARANTDAFITTDRLVKAQGELTQELGVAGTYTGKQAEDFTRLTELIGLSANEAGKLARLAIVNSASIEDTTKSIIRGSAAAQRSNNISIDQRAILKDVSNLSEGILVKFQGNPEALGRAVVEARKLGTTLETIDKIGESLLNFESSIENELKAELLTGRQLNLEKARYAALTGDQISLTKEVANQVGSLADFQNMNVLAQRSLAEAFGLSRDELSKMLIDQEKINKLGDVSKMTFDEQLKALKAQGEPLDSILYKQIQQQSAQDKFNNAVTKLQDIVGNLVAGPLGQMLDMFANIMKHTTVIGAIFGGLAAVSLASTVVQVLNLVKAMRALAVGSSIAEALTNPAALVVGLIAAASAGALVGGLFDSNTQSVKDGISPSSKGPFTITDAYGATAVTAKGDGVAVSPNISKEPINKNISSSAGMDPFTIAMAVNKLNDAVTTLMNRQQPTPQFALHVDGKQLGTVVGQQMETGTSQNIHTGYQIA